MATQKKQTLLALATKAKEARRKVTGKFLGEDITFYAPTLNQVAEIQAILGDFDETLEDLTMIQARDMLWVLGRQTEGWQEAFPTAEDLGEVLTAEDLPELMAVWQQLTAIPGTSEGETQEGSFRPGGDGTGSGGGVEGVPPSA